MTIPSNLIHEFIIAEIPVILCTTVAILVLSFVKDKQLRPKVSVYIGIIFLYPLWFRIFIDGGINTGTELCWTNRFVIGQVSAIAFGFALYCIRRSSGALRVVGSVVATLSVIDLGIIMFKAITRNGIGVFVIR